MFNQNGFNSLNFNRDTNGDTYLSATLSADGTLYGFTNVSLTLQSNLSAEADLQAQIYRTYVFESHLSADGTIESTLSRTRNFGSSLSAEGDLHATLSQFHIKEIIFAGDFKPGDKIVIDMKKMTLTLNGQNMLRMMQGHFFNFNTGTNVVEYTDTSGTRKVTMNITHKDSFI